jgi:hypothetical protein
MSQSKHKPTTTTTTTPLTKPNLEKVPPISTTKLEMFTQTYHHSERLGLGDPTPRTDMRELLESWERQWGRTEKGANNNKAVEKKVTARSRPGPSLKNMLTEY